MIKYQLVCGQGCEFEGWFRCSNTFEVQAAARQVECPHCSSLDIRKSVMAPKVARAKDGPRQASSRGHKGVAVTEAEITEVLRQFRAEVEARAQYVGDKFAAEVRDMHAENAPKRDVWGEATAEEVRELVEDDISVLPVPRLPEDADKN